VQVDPIKPTLRAPGIDRLELYYDEPHSHFAFKFDLWRYTVVFDSFDCWHGAGTWAGAYTRSHFSST